MLKRIYLPDIAFSISFEFVMSNMVHSVLISYPASTFIHILLSICCTVTLEFEHSFSMWNHFSTSCFLVEDLVNRVRSFPLTHNIFNIWSEFYFLYGCVDGWSNVLACLTLYDPNVCRFHLNTFYILSCYHVLCRMYTTSQWHVWCTSRNSFSVSFYRTVLDAIDSASLFLGTKTKPNLVSVMISFLQNIAQHQTTSTCI